jgi:prepilin-type N-terminal cleavage/methylation domain-containing protein
MNKNKGFTIVELIVVIAIIAVLAAIVLVNVTQYINKSKNSAIKGNLASLTTNAAAYFDENATDVGGAFCLDADTGAGAAGPIALAIKGAYNDTADLTCVGDAAVASGGTGTQAWCAWSNTLAVGTTAASTWCVDSTGYKGETHTGCTGTSYTCQ